MRRLMVAGIAALAVAASAACGGGDDAKETKGAATAQVTQAAAAATQAPAAAATTAASPAAQSRTFVDANGKSFNVPTPPKRVVALSPSVVELMYAVGAPPIARPSSATFPEAAKSLPAIGTSYQPNFEQIAAHTPDMIIADAQIQDANRIAELAKLGAPVFAVRVQNVNDVASSLRLVGGLMGKSEEGEKAAKELETKLQSAQGKLPPESQRPSVFVMIGSADQFFGAKPDSFAGDVVAKLGAKNLVQSGPDTSPFPGFTSYSLEQLVALDPDAIVVISVGAPNAPPASKQLASNPAWSGLRAVKGNRVQELPADVLVQGAGPRVGGVIDQLFPLLYPGR